MSERFNLIPRFFLHSLSLYYLRDPLNKKETRLLRLLVDTEKVTGVVVLAMYSLKH